MSGAAASMMAPLAAPTAQQQQQQIPLSARRSGGLDLTTVERRDQTNPFKHLPPKTSRPHDLLEAPTFYPTEEEFRNGPLEFIRKIEPEAHKFGICKIVPPESWKPPFAIDTEKFHFRTRKQELNLADGGGQLFLSLF
jgi:[histone H3]-trimethyl-L-lysine4 demethylase